MSTQTYDSFADHWEANAQLALDTIALKPTRGIPSWMLNDMQWSHLETVSGNAPGSYEKDPIRVYLEFQGFQYEDGMDYERICQMKTRDGGDLFIMGGVSVTTTLPLGKPADIKRQMDWLVEKGPKVGLMLGCSSSVAPGVPLENIKTLIEGFAHYRKHGRNSKKS